MRKTKVEEVQVEHPLEHLFGIDPMSTMMPVVSSEMSSIETPLFDDKDKEIETQFDQITALALDGYDAQVMDLEKIDPKYRARSNEVAIQYLNTALSSTQQKMNLKKHRDLLTSKVVKGTNITNNVLVADRNELLRMMMNGESVV